MNTSTLISELRLLSDGALLENTAASAASEREELARVLAHLAEIERRKLHLQRGYSSLYAYAREALRYSESSAVRRVTAARLALEFPERLEAIAAGKLSLCAAVEAARMFSELRKRPEKPLPVSMPVQPALEMTVAAASVAPPPAGAPAPLSVETKREILDRLERQSRTEASRTLKDLRHAIRGTTEDESPQRPRGRVTPHSRRWEKLELYLSPAERAHWDRARDLLSHAHPSAEPAPVFLRILGEWLERHDPLRQEERAARRAAKKAAPASAELKAAKEPTTVQEPASSPRTGVPAVSREPAAPLSGAKRHRHGDGNPQRPNVPEPGLRKPVPKPIGRQVRIRDQGRCRHVDPETGRRCEATRFLDIDHVTPVEDGGTNALENLRLLCASHNRNRARWEARERAA